MNFLKNIQKLPRPKRVLIFYILLAITMAAIIIIWIWSFKWSLKEIPQRTNFSNLQKLFEMPPELKEKLQFNLPTNQPQLNLPNNNLPL